MPHKGRVIRIEEAILSDEGVVVELDLFLDGLGDVDFHWLYLR